MYNVWYRTYYKNFEIKLVFDKFLLLTVDHSMNFKPEKKQNRVLNYKKSRYRDKFVCPLDWPNDEGDLKRAYYEQTKF